MVLVFRILKKEAANEISKSFKQGGADLSTRWNDAVPASLCLEKNKDAAIRIFIALI